MNKRLLPILADLSSSQSGELPLDLLLRWDQSDKSRDAHGELLAPYTIQGYFLTTDSAGLSKLSQQMSLPEVQREISKPKDLVYAFCTAAGGYPVGIWMADNTECFFPATVPIDTVLQAAVGIQLCNRSNLVQIGMSISFGSAYHLPGGLYGKAADHNEHVAESHTEGGEIVLSQSVLDQFSGTQGWSTTPCDVPGYHRLMYSDLPVPQVEGHYPIPYSESFYQLLKEPQVPDHVWESFMQECYVLLISVVHPDHFLIMDHFSSAAISQHELIQAKHAKLIKSNGMLAIYTSTNAKEIIDDALHLMELLHAAGYTASMGITYGEVFLFELEGEHMEIAGNPVNIASKLAEDSGGNGIMIEQEVTSAVSGLQGEPFGITLSGVTLSGLRIS